MKYKERYRKEQAKKIKRAEVLATIIAFIAIIGLIVGLSAIETPFGVVVTCIGLVCMTIFCSNAEYYETTDDDDDEDEIENNEEC